MGAYMSSKLEIASAASILAGGDKLQAWDDGSVEGDAIAALYDDIYENALAHKAWTFARDIIIPQRVQTEPKTGFKYAYKIPATVIKVLNLGSQVEYKIIKNSELHTNEELPKVECVIKIQEEFLPGDFVLAFKHLLAAAATVPISENTSRAGGLEALGTKFIMQAADNDLAQEPGNYVEEWDLFSAHSGGY